MPRAAMPPPFYASLIVEGESLYRQCPYCKVHYLVLTQQLGLRTELYRTETHAVIEIITDSVGHLLPLVG